MVRCKYKITKVPYLKMVTKHQTQDKSRKIRACNVYWFNILNKIETTYVIFVVGKGCAIISCGIRNLPRFPTLNRLVMLRFSERKIRRNQLWLLWTIYAVLIFSY